MNRGRAVRACALAILAGLVGVTRPCVAGAVSAPAPKRPAVIHQLRIYEIFEGNKQAFHERFRDHAARIMARYDFKIVAMWEATNGERTEFVYLLQWPDKATMTDRWAKFMADQEWSDIKKQTGARQGRMVGEIQDRTLILTNYSPGTATAAGAAAAAAQTPGRPYTGQETRAIKALSEDDVRAYLNGEGMGLAKAAEFNRYPGPKHVLELADALALTPDQRKKVAAVHARMRDAAVALGKQVVDAERTLDTAFARSAIDTAGLRAKVGHIAELQGALRVAHLAAHLETRAILTPAQVDRYVSLRGYGGGHEHHGDHHASPPPPGR
jgi:Spy/CpxP family protein refolding chaperone